LHTLPETGGDTLWGSGYDLYDSLSPTWQKFADGLTATYSQPGFLKSANDHGFKLHTEPRGSPENVGEILEAVHPVSPSW
jgi:alpha-ketoglutarate-dependent taurine dioxygenase